MVCQARATQGCGFALLCWVPLGKLVRHMIICTMERLLTVLSDEVAHQVIRHHPSLRPHARMLHHFRFILPLLRRDSDGLTALHYYDSVIQLVRHASRECTEAEFTIGLNCANEIKTVYVHPCRLLGSY